jgi:phosphate transport system permease protein
MKTLREMTAKSGSRPTDAPGDDAPRRTSQLRRQVTRADALCTLLGLLAAVVTILTVQWIGLGDDLVVALLAYAAFVGTLIVTQLAERRHATTTTAPPREARSGRGVPGSTADWFIDLTEEHERDERGRPAPVVEPEPEPVAPEDERPTRRRSFTRRDFAELFFATSAAAAVAAVIRTIWGIESPVGTGIWFYVAFLLAFYAMVRDRADAEAALDRIVTVVVWSVGVLVIGILAWMLVFLVEKGLPGLTATFFTDDMSQVGPLTPGGGAYHAIVGTIEQVGIAIVIVVPIGILTAVYLHEIQGRLAPPIRFIVDAMSGLPSIVAGLLVFTIWVNGHGFSGFACSVALIVLMLPTITRTSEEILRTIPDALREASLALGAPQWRVVLKVVLPTARAGLVTAAILTLARGVGETAPALLTAFGSDTTNMNPFSGQQSDLPLFIWKLIRLPNETELQRAWTGALVLVLLVLILFVTARFISNRGQRKLGRVR